MFCINSFHQSVTAATHLDRENMNCVELTNLGVMIKILCTDCYSLRICTELNCNEPNFIFYFI